MLVQQPLQAVLLTYVILIFNMAASSDNSKLQFPFNSDQEYELKLGSSFHSKGGPKTAFHTIRCKGRFLTMLCFNRKLERV